VSQNRVKNKEMTAMSQTLPWWLGGRGKDTENNTLVPLP